MKSTTAYAWGAFLILLVVAGCKSTGGDGGKAPEGKDYDSVKEQVDTDKVDQTNEKRAANVSRGNPMTMVTRVWLKNTTRYRVLMNVAGSKKKISGWIEPFSKKYVDVKNHGGYIATWAYAYDGERQVLRWKYREWNLGNRATFTINFRQK